MNQQKTFRKIVTGHNEDGKSVMIADATNEYALNLLGKDAIAELYFLIGSYSLIATILNGFNILAPSHGNQTSFSIKKHQLQGAGNELLKK